MFRKEKSVVKGDPKKSENRIEAVKGVEQREGRIKIIQMGIIVRTKASHLLGLIIRQQ